VDASVAERTTKEQRATDMIHADDVLEALGFTMLRGW
jgi:hypothetical protein